jgi:hypothetical protein
LSLKLYSWVQLLLDKSYFRDESKLQLSLGWSCCFLASVKKVETEVFIAFYGMCLRCLFVISSVKQSFIVSSQGGGGDSSLPLLLWGDFPFAILPMLASYKHGRCLCWSGMRIYLLALTRDGRECRSKWLLLWSLLFCAFLLVFWKVILTCK